MSQLASLSNATRAFAEPSGWGRENGELGLSLYLEVKLVSVAL